MTRRAQVVGAVANVGGLAIGPLATGVLARYAPGGLTLPYVVLLVGLVVALLGVALAPEGRPPSDRSRGTGRSGSRCRRLPEVGTSPRSPERPWPSPRWACSRDSPGGSSRAR